MTAVVIGVPAILPPDPSGHPGWEKTRSTWTTHRGEVWDLTNPDMGVFLRREGVRGLGMPTPIHYRDQLNTVPGQTYRGTTYGSREVFWPVRLFHDGSSREYVARDDLWWKGLHPRHTGTWTIEVPGISKRYLDLRFDDDSDWAPEFDPPFFGWADYGVNLLAEQPFWRGDPINLVFKPATPHDFFGGSSPGDPIIAISSGTALTSASIANPGDEAGWGVWTVRGPNEGATIVIDGQTIEIPWAMEEGEYVVLDSRPTQRTAFDQDGNDRFEDLGQVAWGAVPEDGTSDLTLTLAGGTGEIDFSFDPLYHRAWGLAQ